MTITEPTTVPAWLNLDELISPAVRAEIAAGIKRLELAVPAILDLCDSIITVRTLYTQEILKVTESAPEGVELAELADQFTGMRRFFDLSLMLAQAMEVAHEATGPNRTFQGNIDRFDVDSLKLDQCEIDILNTLYKGTVADEASSD